MKIRVCDLCGSQLGYDGDLKFKYKAKQCGLSFYENWWNKIEICGDCVNHIVFFVEDKKAVNKE